jgi:hypothetical protein
MQNDVRRTFHELYVVEIDGVKQSEHRVFIEALKRGLELKRQYPRISSRPGRAASPVPPTPPCRSAQKPKRENSADPGCVDCPGSLLWHPCISPSLFGGPAGT